MRPSWSRWLWTLWKLHGRISGFRKSFFWNDCVRLQYGRLSSFKNKVLGNYCHYHLYVWFITIYRSCCFIFPFCCPSRVFLSQSLLITVSMPASHVKSESMVLSPLYHLTCSLHCMILFLWPSILILQTTKVFCSFGQTDFNGFCKQNISLNHRTKFKKSMVPPTFKFWHQYQ